MPVENIKYGSNFRYIEPVNLYGCEFEDNVFIGPFVEIQSDVKIGSNTKVQSHSFICTNVTVGQNCFIGHGVMFINDNYPKSVNPDGSLQKEDDWKHRYVETDIGNNVIIGSNATILGGVTIDDKSIIGAGSVITKNIPSGEIWAGNPAEFKRKI